MSQKIPERFTLKKKNTMEKYQVAWNNFKMSKKFSNSELQKMSRKIQESRGKRKQSRKFQDDAKKKKIKTSKKV